MTLPTRPPAERGQSRLGWMGRGFPLAKGVSETSRADGI